MTATPVSLMERWDVHYANAGPQREHGNPWRYTDDHELAALAAHVAQSAPGACALDVGCGTGDLAAGLARLGYTAIGIDVAPTAITRARHLHPHVTFMCGDATDTALSPGAYALITLRLVFPFLPDHDAFLARARHLLAPGGQLLVVDYLATDPPAKARGIGLTDHHLAQLSAWSAHVDRYETEGLRGYRCTPTA